MRLFIRINYADTVFENFVELTHFPATLGRSPLCDCRLMGEEISGVHARVTLEQDQFVLQELVGAHGAQSSHRVIITEGQVLAIGRAELHFSLVSFPLGAPAAPSNLPSRRKPYYERFLDLRGAFTLFLIYTLLAFLTAPNAAKKSDALKEVVAHTLKTVMIVPLLLFFVIIIFRKLNRGQYSWRRSLCFALGFGLLLQVVGLVQKLFCWFTAFSYFWMVVANFALPVVLFFLWLNAVGKDSSQKSRWLRALSTTFVLLALSGGVRMLATGYHSDYEIESCYSVTGWHWGAGDSLEKWQAWTDEAAKKLR